MHSLPSPHLNFKNQSENAQNFHPGRVYPRNSTRNSPQFRVCRMERFALCHWQMGRVRRGAFSSFEMPWRKRLRRLRGQSLAFSPCLAQCQFQASIVPRAPHVPLAGPSKHMTGGGKLKSATCRPAQPTPPPREGQRPRCPNLAPAQCREAME